MKDKLLGRKKETLKLIGLAYLIPIVIFFIALSLSYLPLNTFVMALRFITTIWLLLFPGLIFVMLFYLVAFYLFGLPAFEFSSGGESGAFFSPITIIASFIFWMGLIWIIYLLIRNKSYIKKKIGLFVISFITSFIVLVSLKTFYSYIGDAFSLFFLILALAIIAFTIFILHRLLWRIN